jgi:RNA polymerase sigma factor (sigma-70 family)
MEDLYSLFSGGIRFYLWRELGAQDLSDRIHDLFIMVTQSIRAGDLRDPERFMGYVRTVVRRQVAGHIHYRDLQRKRCCELDLGRALTDGRPNQEHHLIARQRREIAGRILRAMHEREREVLIRFYLKEQAPSQICREMLLTETQFRLLKSRAKARFGALCRNRLSETPAHSRKPAGVPPDRRPIA